MRRGVIPDWMILELIEAGAIIGADPSMVNTSSIDLKTGNNKWKLVGSFLPVEGQKIQEVLSSRIIVDVHSDKDPFYVEHMQPYLIELVESLNLPSTVSARVFNKSGRGRIGVASKGLTDGNSRFDVVRRGYKGKLYVEVTATSFPLVIYSGKTAIPQIRFYEGDPEPLYGSELELLLNKYPILMDDNGNASYSEAERQEMIRTGKLTFTAEITSGGLLAYVARKDRRNIDLSKIGHYNPLEYFNEVKYMPCYGNALVIHPGDFVLVNSSQNIRLPPFLAAEIDEYSPELGDMKTHYAGLINASHGYDIEDPNIPSHIVFEIRARDMPVVIQNGQPLARFNLFNMLDEPRGRYMSRRSTGFGDLKSVLPNLFNKK